MKIVYLTAGAAGMYCGSCMHDNTLAKSMIACGSDTLLVPTYTPIRTDEQSVSQERVFFGGLNIYLQQIFPPFRYAPKWLDRVLDSPKLIKWVASRAMKTSAKQLGALTVSMLRGKEGNQRKEVDQLCKWLAGEIKPDAIVLTNLLIAGFVPEFKKRLNVPVAVTLQGDDIFLDSLPEPYQSQALMTMRRLVKDVDAFIVHSEAYAAKMGKKLDIPSKKIHVMPLAIDMESFKRATTGEKVLKTNPTIAYMARLAPEKGLHLLVDAFIELHQKHQLKNVHLEIAGWLGPTQYEFWDQQKKKLDDAGLQDRYRYAGQIEHAAKIEFLRSADLLCVPTTYEEPKGLFVLESLACGTPVVLPEHGAFPEVLKRLGGGWLIPPGNVSDLVHKLQELLADRNHLKQRGEEVIRYVQQEGDIRTMAERTIRLLEQLAGK